MYNKSLGVAKGKILSIPFLCQCICIADLTKSYMPKCNQLPPTQRHHHETNEQLSAIKLEVNDEEQIHNTSAIAKTSAFIKI